VDAVKVSGSRLGLTKGALKAPVISVAVLITLGMALRLPPLVGDPLHQDEALYGFWGRLVSSGRDPWLATVAVDKPPLVPYLIAGSETLFGANAFALRMPSLAASVLAVALTFSLASRLYNDRITALIAAGVMALTPYPVLLGATAFTDSILVSWWLAACGAALSGHWGWAGLLLGLAFAAKQQAIVLAPLVVGLGIIRWRQASRSKVITAGSRFALGIAAIVAIVFVWDGIRLARGAGTGFWAQGIDSYGGLRFIWPAELKPRLLEWSRLGGYFFGWSWVGTFFLIGVASLLWRDLARRRRTQAALADLMLCVFALSFLFLHWLLAFPVWDRYLLALAPVIGLLLGRALSVAWKLSGRRRGSIRALRLPFIALVAALLMATGFVAASGRMPVGGDHGAYDGLEEVMDYLRALPVGTVLYDRWLTWHYDFYLFDAYLYRAGFPSPAWLATDAASFFDGRPRYLVLPDWEPSMRLERALAQVSLTMSPVLTAHRRDGTASFVIYEIGQ